MASVKLFRSEEMVYMQSILPAEACRSFVHQAALLQCVQFTDLNAGMNAFQRRFTKDVTRVMEIERRLGAIETQLTAREIKFARRVENPEFLESKDDLLDSIEQAVERRHAEIVEATRVIDELQTNLSMAKEFEMVLNETGKLLQYKSMAQSELSQRQAEAMAADAAAERESSIDHQSLLDEDRTRHVQTIDPTIPMLSAQDREAQYGTGLQSQALADSNFSYVAGVVPRAMKPVLERQGFLISRGKMMMVFADAVERDGVMPFVFYFIGGTMRKKVTRLCESLGVRLYLFPESNQDLSAQAVSNTNQINTLTNIINQTEQNLNQSLRYVGERFAAWKLFLLQERSLNIVLNGMSIHGPTMIAEFWMPKADVPAIQTVLDRINSVRGLVSSLQQINTDAEPPTYFRLNEFTSAFQQIVNTYGVPKYQEVNPAVFTIVTFPFLFGVMFGDIGHGGMLFLFGLLLCLFSDRLKAAAAESELAAGFYSARYLLMMMGFFAFYCGWIYNDFLSVSINLGSRYEYVPSNGTVITPGAVIPSCWNPRNYSIDEACRPGGSDDVYAFGLDPVWHGTTTQLAYTNSLKMKIAVSLGVVQMTFGIILSAFNFKYFGETLSIWTEFLPQMIFMLSLFGYMITMIVIKWSINWDTAATVPGCADAPAAPNLITTMINMFLSIGTVECKSLLYTGQGTVQAILVALAGISVPWMLVSKPLILYFRSQDEHHAPLNDASDVESQAVAGELPKAHKHEMSEIVIHQMIHTIEFVLGTVSNTASYLRLWALSLAHAELADVFFEKVLVTTWKTGSPLMIVVGAAMWLSATIAVLMAMDVLECFLHALRLHWVEFQSKFYAASGVAFVPLSFAALEDA